MARSPHLLALALLTASVGACELDRDGTLAGPGGSAGSGLGGTSGSGGLGGSTAGAGGAGTGGAGGVAGTSGVGGIPDAGHDAPTDSPVDAADAGFTLASIPMLRGWYAELVTEQGGAVNTWLDKSGQGNDLSQSDPALRPQYTAADPALNGSSSLQFNGSSLIAASAIPWQFLHDGSGMTVIIVAISQGNQALDALLDTAGGSSSKVGTYLRNDAAKMGLHLYVFNGNASSIPISTPALPGTFQTSVPVIITAAYAEGTTPTEYILRVNGSEIAAGDSVGQPVNAPPSYPLQIGARGPTFGASFLGTIAEVAIYARRITTSELAQAEADVATRHGIALATP